MNCASWTHAFSGRSRSDSGHDSHIPCLTEKCRRNRLARADGTGKRNALNMEMIRGLRSRCCEIEGSDAIAAILFGAGPVFCAGGDIGAWGGLTPASFSRERIP